MIKKSKLFSWFNIILACSLGTYFFYMINANNHKAPLHKADLVNAIDATIQDLSVKEFNQKGELVNSLQTPLIKHIPYNNTHILTAPKIIVKEEEKGAWEINAQSATAVKGGSQITFSDDVRITQKKNDGGDLMLLTEEITYFPKDKYAITEKDVKLQQAKSIIEATGLKAFLAENRIQFLNNARGHYEQNNG